MKEMDQSPILVKPTPSSPVSNSHLVLDSQRFFYDCLSGIVPNI